MSYRLEKRVRFEAAHQLHGHDGKCARLHGHSWVAVVILVGTDVERHGPKAGMLIDYGDVSLVLRPIVESFLDHHDLNATLQSERPTSEFVARWLFAKLATTELALYLEAVRVEETCTSAAEYRL